MSPKSVILTIPRATLSVDFKNARNVLDILFLCLFFRLFTEKM